MYEIISEHMLIERVAKMNSDMQQNKKYRIPTTKYFSLLWKYATRHKLYELIGALEQA